MAGTFPFSTALPITVPSSVSVSNSNSSSGGQVVVNGTGVNFNIAASNPVQASQGTSNSKEKPKPFVLKLKTKQIRICQSCRKDYDGANDTLGLVVARAEGRLVSNFATGVQFLGRESNSHYHAHKSCLTKADATFNGQKVVIPPDVRVKLDAYQKVYLSTCLDVPFEALDVHI